MYCSAPGSAAGHPCAIAAEVEADWTSRVNGGYDPHQHLLSMVGALRHRRGKDWRVEQVSATEGGTPRVRFTVTRDGEVVAEGVSVVRDLAAREAVAGVWRDRLRK